MKGLDAVFDLLSVERRRFVLYYLEDQSGPVPVSELAEVVREWETGSSAREDVHDVEERIAIKLQHQDVPKMAEAEYVEYDPGNDEIEVSGIPAEIRVILSVTRAIEQPDEEDIVHL